MCVTSLIPRSCNAFKVRTHDLEMKSYCVKTKVNALGINNAGQVIHRNKERFHGFLYISGTSKSAVRQACVKLKPHVSLESGDTE